MMTKFSIHEILTYLPHRYPFLLIDRVLEFEKGKSLLALKNVTHNEPFFTGHFPENPVMPGVIVIEALAQAAGFLSLVTNDIGPNHNQLFYFAGIDRARFRRVIEPGDQLLLHVKVEKIKNVVHKFSTKATVDGELACSADLMLAKNSRS